MRHRVCDPSELGKANRRHRKVHWRKGINRIIIALLCTLVALLVAFFPLVATAQTQPITTAQAQPENQSRCERGNQVINKPSGGAGQPVLDALRQDFPFLADAITNYALGEVWSRRGLDDRTRQLATVAAFAAQGNLPQIKIHAGYALRLGATQDELKEIVYLTTVTAGFPRSIDAAQALREVFTASSRRSSTAQ
ncbi:MAG TPA: carboxymuconolactone decarboxylase family protein [Coleofasciculaceae cyanobacterium]|jgi:4-carboxymuconolactone decarboxylase